MPRGEPQRWTFLQTVAEYAAEQLEADRGEDLVRERHVRWMTAFAAEADRLLLEPGGLELVDHETPNLRVALEWAIQHDPGAALTLVASLIRHWIMAEHFAEGSTSTAAALSVAGEGDVGPRAVVHCGAGVIGTLREKYESALADTYRGLSLLGDVQDPETQARCLQMSGMVLILTGVDLAGGLASTSRAVELLRSSSDPLGLAWALVSVAMAESICDRFDAARTAYDEFLTWISGAFI
jgi:hypothetical protein